MREITEKALEPLDAFIESWTSCKPKILTSVELDDLGTIAKKNLRGQKLNERERKMKSYIHKRFAGAIADLKRMNMYGFLCPEKQSRWNPITHDFEAKNRPIWSDGTWREDFPINDVACFVSVLVQIFGDEYAVPLAKAIEEGANLNQANAGMKISVGYTKSVQVAHFGVRQI